LNNRPRIVISHRVFPETLNHLRSFAEVLAPIEADALPAADLERKLATAEGWMAFMPDSADERVLERCPRLRVIAGALKGCDNFDVQACTRRGVWFTLVQDLLTTPLPS